MAEDIPDWARKSATAADEDVPAWARQAPARAPAPGIHLGGIEAAADPLMRIPQYATQSWHHGLQEAGLEARPGEPAAARPPYYDPEHPYWSAFKHAVPDPRVALGALEATQAWPAAFYHSIVGQPSQEVSQGLMETAGVPQSVAHPIAEVIGGTLETGAGLGGTLPGVGKVPGFAEVIPGRAPVAPAMRMPKLGMELTEAQITRDPVKAAFEREAAAGARGEPAQTAARAAFERQKSQLPAVTEDVQRQLDPLGRVVAGDPHEAARIIGEGTRARAAAQKEGVDVLYQAARRGGAAEGAIDLGVFGGNMGRGIRDELFRGAEPVIISNRQTPNAASMTGWLNQQPDKLLRDLDIRIPQGSRLAGMDLTMVEQMRKRLSSLRRGAFSSGNREDARAAVAVLDKFDERIDAAMDAGLFRRPDGSPADPRILQAWKDARAAHADYKATFFRGGREDAVGRAMEKIVGGRGRPGEIPDKIADHLWGSSGIAPSSANVELSRRMLNMYPEGSVERGAVRQGLLSRIIEPPPGVTPFSHDRVADRLNTFLNTEMANVAYEPWQRDLLREYADLRRSLAHSEKVHTPTIGGQSDYLARTMAGRVASYIGHAAGHLISDVPLVGHVLGPLARYGAEKTVQLGRMHRDAKRVERQMGAIGKAWQDYARAVTIYERVRTGRAIARVSLAARNLDNNLRPIGTSLMEITQAPATQPTPAAPSQPVQQPPQQDQGPIGESHIY
jgi:hypothetical protein